MIQNVTNICPIPNAFALTSDIVKENITDSSAVAVASQRLCRFNEISKTQYAAIGVSTLMLTYVLLVSCVYVAEIRYRRRCAREEAEEDEAKRRGTWQYQLQQSFHNRVVNHTHELSSDNPIKAVAQKYIFAHKAQSWANWARSWVPCLRDCLREDNAFPLESSP